MCRLCIIFLGFDVFFVVFCVALACVIGIAVCCCLPCIIAILYAVADQVILYTVRLIFVFFLEVEGMWTTERNINALADPNIPNHTYCYLHSLYRHLSLLPVYFLSPDLEKHISLGFHFSVNV